jgi:hypothetical protein
VFPSLVLKGNRVDVKSPAPDKNPMHNLLALVLYFPKQNYKIMMT